MPKKLTTKEFVEKSIKKHGSKYDYTIASYINGKTKVGIICKYHGVFNQMPINHIFGQGCPICGKNAKRHSLDEFIRKAKYIHGEKYDYSLTEYKNSYTKIKIICKKHGIFKQAPSGHLTGNGCKKCHRESTKTGINTFIKKATEVHASKYDYSLTVYVNARTKIKIICPTHGVFYQTPNSHLLGTGCKKCYYEKKYSNKEEFVKKSMEIHGNKYDYTLVEYIHARKPVKIICNTHGVFKQTPNNHLRGQRCKMCSPSNGEKKIYDYLSSNGIKVKQQKRFKNCKNKKPLSFDFYLPDYNLLIEYDGEQHYKPIDYFGGVESLMNVMKNDKIKNIWCLDNGITLLRIPYTSFDKIEEILERYLKKYANTEK